MTPDLLRCSKIDRKLELDRLFNRDIGRVGAFKNTIDVECGAVEGVVQVRAVAHETALLDEINEVINTRRRLLVAN